MSKLPVSGRLIIPREVQEVAERGLFKISDWRKVFRYLERGAMGQGGILERHLDQPEVAVPLTPETLAKKRSQGLTDQPLIGKRGRIQKALSKPTSTFRKRDVFKTRDGRVMFRVYFNPDKFSINGSKDTWTRVLQRGRISGITKKDGRKLDRAEAVKAAKSKGIEKGDTVHRMPGRAVLNYYPGDESKLTPALLKAVYQVLKEKGLAE